MPSNLGGPGRPGQVPLLLAMAFRAMTDRFHARLAELGREPLRPAHGYAFRYLSAHADATVVDLAAHLDVSKQAASKTVTELEGWGYLERRPHPGDRRAQIVALTPRGRDYLDLADRLWTEAERELTDLIGPARLAAMSEDLHAYLHHVHGEAPIPLRPVW